MRIKLHSLVYKLRLHTIFCIALLILQYAYTFKTAVQQCETHLALLELHNKCWQTPTTQDLKIRQDILRSQDQARHLGNLPI